MINPARVYFSKQLPVGMDLSNSILIYDSVLQKKYSKWIKKFPKRLSVKSGEKLKDLRSFHRSVEKILQLSEGIARTQLTIVAFGGGSIGDFAGFTASVLKRGVRLVHVPSTWLAAMDSAHGGKTALNVGSVKNQIGSFYSAEKIYLVKAVLQQVPAKRIQEALGEFYKMSFIDGGKLWQLASHHAQPGVDFLWKTLPLVIRAKMKIVNIDPYELKNKRHLLNLGHTVGHVLESELGLAHGSSVHLGLRFALQWSQHKNYSHFSAPSWMLPSSKDLAKKLARVKNPSHLLLLDKKISSVRKIKFIFIKKPGSIFVKDVSFKELVAEWRRQSWLREQ